MLKVYNFPRGARGLRVMWQCEEMELPYEFEAVNFPPGDAYRALNPLGSVPYLQDGEAGMSESLGMMIYLARRYGPTPLWPQDDPATEAAVLQWTTFGEASLGAGLNPLMETKFAGPPAEQSNWTQQAQTRRATGFIAHAGAALGDRTFLVGETLTLADICVVTAFAMWRGALGGDLPANLAAYQERLTSRPGYQAAQARMG